MDLLHKNHSKIQKSSISPPYQLYFTVHIDKNGNDSYASTYQGGTYILVCGID